MAQDPWKKAYLLSKALRAGQAPKGGVAKPLGQVDRAVRPTGRTPNWGCIIGVSLLVLLAGAGVALWLFRWWWVPRYRPELPKPVQQALPEPRVQVDVVALDSGLGVDLVMFGDYLAFVNATRDWGPGWTLSNAGGEQRLSADGVKVYVRDGLIMTYDLNLQQIYADNKWLPWQTALRKAQLTPDLTYSALTGGQEMPAGDSEVKLKGQQQAKLKDGWASAVYILHFQDGWLRRVVGAVEFGPSAASEPAGKSAGATS